LFAFILGPSPPAPNLTIFGIVEAEVDVVVVEIVVEVVVEVVVEIVVVKRFVVVDVFS